MMRLETTTSEAEQQNGLDASWEAVPAGRDGTGSTATTATTDTLEGEGGASEFGADALAAAEAAQQCKAAGVRGVPQRLLQVPEAGRREEIDAIKADAAAVKGGRKLDRGRTEAGNVAASPVPVAEFVECSNADGDVVYDQAALDAAVRGEVDRLVTAGTVVPAPSLESIRQQMQQMREEEGLQANAAARAAIPCMDIANAVAGLANGDAFAFNVMVVGESGLGKTTFLKSICSCLPGGNGQLPQGMQAHDGSKTVGEPTSIYRHEYENDGVTYRFSAVDAAGFEAAEAKQENHTIMGERLNAEASFTPIMQYITNKQDQWDQSTNADGISDRTDERVHLLFYFITPHRVKDIDLSFMERFASVVPLVPIIAKADTLCEDELRTQLGDLQKKMGERSIPTCAFGEKADENGWLLDVRSYAAATQCDAEALEVEAVQAQAEEKAAEHCAAAEQERTATQALADVAAEYRTAVLDLGMEDEQSAEQLRRVATDAKKAGSSLVLQRYAALFAQANTASAVAGAARAESARWAASAQGTARRLDQKREFLVAENAQSTQPPQLPRKADLFAVITAAPGKTRKYAWGTADPNNELHSDFRRLTRLLFGERCVHLKGIVQNAKQLAYLRIQAKPPLEKIANHPWTPAVCVTFGVLFLAALCVLVTQSWMQFCCALMSGASFWLAAYAKMQQDLRFRCRVTEALVYLQRVLVGAAVLLVVAAVLQYCRRGY
jgi:septin family protein